MPSFGESGHEGAQQHSEHCNELQKALLDVKISKFRLAISEGVADTLVNTAEEEYVVLAQKYVSLEQKYSATCQLLAQKNDEVLVLTDELSHADKIAGEWVTTCQQQADLLYELQVDIEAVCVKRRGRSTKADQLLTCMLEKLRRYART